MAGWQSIDALQVTILLAVFLAVALGLEGLQLWWWRQRSPAARRLQARLRSWLPTLDDGNGTARSAPSASGLLAAPGPRHGLALRLLQAGWGWSAPTLSALCAVLALVALLAVLLVGGPALPAALAAAVAGATPMVLLEQQRQRRLQRLGGQLPDALDLMSRALQSGHAFPSALQMAGDECPAPIGPILKLTHDQITYGRDPDDALDELARRAPSDEMRFFVMAVRLQRQTGGRLAEVLGHIAELVRQRQRLHDTVRVLSAEGRLSAMVLGALPLLTAAAIHAIRPDFIAVLWTDPAGRQWLQLAIALFLLGLVWLWRLTRIRV